MELYEIGEFRIGNKILILESTTIETIYGIDPYFGFDIGGRGYGPKYLRLKDCLGVPISNLFLFKLGVDIESAMKDITEKSGIETDYENEVITIHFPKVKIEINEFHDFQNFYYFLTGEEL